TGDWGNWTYHLDNMTLNAGNNIIKYQKVSNDGHYLNVDYLALKEAVLTTTAYRWWGNDSSTSDSNKILAPELHDNDITTDVALAGGGEEVSPNKYEAAGLIFSYAQTITKVEFINGTYRGGNDDGSFEEVFKLQTSTDGTTWTDATEWTVSPAYEFLQTSISGATFTFTGSATNILGVRVIGKVRTSESSGSWEARVREITAYGLISEVSEVMKESSVSIFPNPLSTGSLLIKLPESATQLSIFDITGKAVYQTPVTKSEYLIDQSVFKTEGVYIVNVMTLNNSMNKKVIVTK
ncbi:MAG: T9SS type A sorting domain-containing protein, partial [Paludibacter sp.]|nr:T9SS type A sorting domain-containing protein [Paludibacter sp.]